MSAEHPPAAAAAPPVRTSLRLVWLAGLVYAVAAATHPGANGRHLAAALLTGCTAIGWAAWLTAQHRGNRHVSVGGIALLAASGGALVVLHPVGVAVVGIAGMCAASSLDVLPAAALTSAGVVAAAIAVAVTGHSPGVIASAASGAAAGLVVGMGRRQAQDRARQDAELALARERSALDRERADVLAERNHVAREVHDVLAHTLSALSVQMEAVGSLLDDGSPPERVRDAVGRSQRLVRDGLEETRRAVRVLRDEPVDVVAQLALLSEDGNASFRVEGRPRDLPPAGGLTLVRAAQEALTNVRKHAAGAAVTVELLFGPGEVQVTVVNATTGPSAIAHTGSGYGLQGMRERLELVGGSLDAGPDGAAWRLRAVVPA